MGIDFNLDNNNNPFTAKYETYWAAQEDATKVATVALDKGQSFFNMLRANAYLEKLNRMWRYYHGAFSEDLGYGHRINFTGEQGEYVNLMVNHFRNIAQHIYVMVTANRPKMECRAINTDYKSLSQTYLANGILDYYMREKGLESALKYAAEMCIVLGSAYIKMEWNATAGEQYDYDEETGQYTYEGEMEFTNLSPLDVVTDGTKERFSKEWVLCRSFQNRYNLIAKYPELREKILNISPKNQSTVYRLAVFSNDDTDDIAVYELFHERCEALPDGRYVLFLDSDLVLMDVHLPYRQVPIFRVSPADIMGTPYGYSPMFDLFPIQEAINAEYSTIMTNHNAFGVQNLFVPLGSQINVNALGGALNIIEGTVKPEPLQLTATPPEVFKFLEFLIQSMESISGVNSVTRGQPEASLKSGAALALVQSTALQFVSGLQQSYVKLMEDVGTSLISTLKDYATTPKVIAIVGKNNRSRLKEFTGDKISAVSRVVVDVGNPLASSIAGKVQIAEQMLQMGLIKTPEQYEMVMTTGRLDSLYEGEMDELLLIKRENEELLEGENPLVAPTDAHKTHILEHKAVLADPDLRKDPRLVKVVMDHIEMHLNALKNVDPNLLTLVGEQAIAPQGPPPQQGPPPPQGGGAPEDGQDAPQPQDSTEAPQAGQPLVVDGKPTRVPKPATPPPPFENSPTDPRQGQPNAN